MPSTVVEFAKYDADDKILEIKYRNGRVYRYFGVPQTEYDAFKSSGSKGRYLNREIKTKYEFAKV